MVVMVTGVCGVCGRDGLGVLGLRGVKGLAEGFRTCVFLTGSPVLDADPGVAEFGADEVLMSCDGGVVLSVGVELILLTDTGVSIFVMGVCMV